MNIQQLRIIRQTVRSHFNLTEVGNALYTSQSGVSKHIKDLEDELGVALFTRRGKRLLGLTEPGRELLQYVEHVLQDIDNIKRLSQQYVAADAGNLVVATTHTQARYVLPPVVSSFKNEYPKVHLQLHQGSPDEIVQLLRSGEADIGLATEALADVEEFISLPCYSWYHAVIALPDHPLVNEKKLTLAKLAEYPIITYHQGFTGRARIDKTFAEADLQPDIVLSALDSDVIKTYVELGLGVGIIAGLAWQEKRDRNLARIDCKDLFPINVTRIAVRRGRYLRGFARRFIELVAPDTNPENLAALLDSDNSAVF